MRRTKLMGGNRREAMAATPFLNRRQFIAAALAAAAAPITWGENRPSHPELTVDAALRQDWLPRWEKYILDTERERYCDKEMGEELGWLISPVLQGFYFGYMATRDTAWLDRLVAWTDALIQRGIREPDGFIGWPKDDATGTAVVPGLYTDSLIGEAMALLPVVKAAGVVGKDPALKARYGSKMDQYLKLSEQIFDKWDSRGAWRDVKDGGVWVVPEFGIDRQTKGWTSGYEKRSTTGFSNPDNKLNFISLWLLAMHDLNGKAIYRERAEKWFRTMKSRMQPREGKYYVWNYWDPAGPWDYKPDGSTRHWVGVHPNGGYYEADLKGIVAAYEHGLVFDKQDIARLIATNRDFMWNQKIKGADFQRIDGDHDDHQKGSGGALWLALLPYDATLRKIFEANHKPDSWGGMAETPWYLAGCD